MIVIKLEKNGKIIKSWEFDRVDDELERSILEMINSDVDFIKKFRREDVK